MAGLASKSQWRWAETPAPLFRPAEPHF